MRRNPAIPPLLVFLMLFLTGLSWSPARSYGQSFDALIPATAIDWPYEIPARLTDGSSVPIMIEMEPLSPATRDNLWGVMATPYVYSADGTKQYMTMLDGAYRPVAGQQLVKAVEEKRLLKFHVYILLDDIKEPVGVIKRLRVFSMPEAAAKPGSADRVFSGNFKTTPFDVWLETADGIKKLHKSRQKWVMQRHWLEGEQGMGTPPSRYSLAVQGLELTGTYPDWEYEIPLAAVIEKVNPIRFDISQLPSSITEGEYWGALATPYVYREDGVKQYLARSNGKYRPVAGKQLLQAQEDKQLLSFHICFFDKRLDEEIQAIQRIGVEEMPPAQQKTGTNQEMFSGDFKNLPYEIMVKTPSGNRKLEDIQRKWIFGDVVTSKPPAMFALVNLPGNLSARNFTLEENLPAFKQPAVAKAKAKPEPPPEKPAAAEAEKPAAAPQTATPPVTDTPRQAAEAPMVAAEPAAEKTPAHVATSIVFSLARVPEASRDQIKSSKDIGIDDGTVNGKPMNFRAVMLEDYFEIVRADGIGYTADDRVAFTLSLPGLHPENILVTDGTFVQPRYAVKQKINLIIADEKGTPLSGLRFNTMLPGGQPQKTAASDNNGQITLAVPKGVSDLEVWFDGNDIYGELARTTLKVKQNVPLLRGQITLRPVPEGKRLKFMVVDLCNKPLADAAVTVKTQRGKEVPIPLNNPDEALFAGPVPAADTDTFTYRVTAPGFRTANSPRATAFQAADDIITVTMLSPLTANNLKVIVTGREDGKTERLNNAKGTITYLDSECSEKTVPLRYNRSDTTYSASLQYKAGTRPRVSVKAGEQFEEFRGGLTGAETTIEMNYAKPFLYVFINANEQLKRGPIKQNPSLNFNRFKDKFLDLMISLGMEKDWEDHFSKTYIYSLNKNQPATVLREPGDLMLNWLDGDFQKIFLSKVEMRNSYVPYQEVVRLVSDSLDGYSFRTGQTRGVLLYILGAPPTAIYDPLEDLGPLQTLMAEKNIAGLVAQYADGVNRERVDFTAGYDMFKNLRLIEMNIDQEFNDLYFGASMEYIKKSLADLLEHQDL